VNRQRVEFALKVLMVYPDFAEKYRNGIISVMSNLPQSLRRKGCEVKTIQFTKEKTLNDPDSSEEVLVYKKKVNLSSLFHLASEVKKETKGAKYDIVHGHTGPSAFYKIRGSDVPACVTNHGIGYKVYHFYWKYKAFRDHHDLLPYLKYYPLKAYDVVGGRLLYSKADRITTVSNFAKHEFSKIYGLPEGKIDAVPNGVRTDVFTPNIKTEEKEKIIERYAFEKALLFLPPVPRKGLHFVIKALPALVKEAPNLKLLVVGGIGASDTYYKFCNKLSRKLKVEKRVLFVGWVNDVDLPKYYSVASAFVLPSSYEALPITILESMACGTPVCTSKAWGSSEIIDDGQDGFIRDPSDTNSFEEALITLLNDDALRKRMSLKCREKIKTQYSWDNIADQYIGVYEKTVESKLS
jgi:glycosyltransferase involved in cell wall biosynthesis